MLPIVRKQPWFNGHLLTFSARLSTTTAGANNYISGLVVSVLCISLLVFKPCLYTWSFHGSGYLQLVEHRTSHVRTTTMYCRRKLEPFPNCDDHEQTGVVLELPMCLRNWRIVWPWYVYRIYKYTGCVLLIKNGWDTNLTPEEMFKDCCCSSASVDMGTEMFAACLLAVTSSSVGTQCVCQNQTVSDSVKFVSLKGFTEWTADMLLCY